ncbi:MAG: hypothetical protein GF350_11910 [Chitinivibrionales bacterium]|nr:hypothetical protein [Chitinivibrionales bacterium]
MRQIEFNEKFEPTEKKIGTVEIVQNSDENRTQIFFPAKPPYEVRQLLKQNGFRWYRTGGCWQRHLSRGAEYAAEKCATLYMELSPKTLN